MVRDVTPFEHMKLRMLNGTHSSLAYLGYLAGHQTIAETVADPVFADFVRHLWRAEIIPAVKPPPGESLSAYAEALFARYCQSGDPPPHLADRHGRQPEAAAAHPGHPGREPEGRPAAARG